MLRRLRAEIPRVGALSASSEVEAVGVPTGLHCYAGDHVAVAVIAVCEFEQAQFRSIEREQPPIQLARQPRGMLAVPGMLRHDQDFDGEKFFVMKG